MKVLLFCIGAISIMASNKCHKSSSPAMVTAPLVELETFGCRGFCPTYKLRFFNTGMVAYEGTRNVVKPGTDTIILTDKELKQLNESLESVNLWQYPERIEATIVDAPFSKLTVFDSEKSHGVMGSVDRPKPLMEFEALLKDLAELHGLKVKEGVNPYEAPKNQQEILLKLAPEVNPGNFMMQLEEIRLRIIRRVSAENEWLIGYNPDQISQKQLIELLSSMDGVLDAGPVKK
ncbi:MAG: DUF6438 domain-containing protein [Saprospiraceae bacterium]|nr:hypothetical protein [Saprospiraceae bacterium]MCB9345531.1 hypothetical protein [Lewinellaceae bacterium]